MNSFTKIFPLKLLILEFLNVLFCIVCQFLRAKCKNLEMLKT